MPKAQIAKRVYGKTLAAWRTCCSRFAWEKAEKIALFEIGTPLCLNCYSCKVPRGANKTEELETVSIELPASEGWSKETIAVTPGVLDQRAEDAYLNGQCAALAVAIWEKAGGSILLIRSQSGQAVHVGVETVPGVVCDIFGARPLEDWLEDPRFNDPDDPNDFAEEITSKQALEIPDFPRQHLDVARTFVSSALEAK